MTSAVAAAALSAALLPATAVAAQAAESAQPQPVAPAADAQAYAVGMGDSYMSGEGGVWSNRGWSGPAVGNATELRYWSTGAAVPKVSGGGPNEDGFYSGFVYGDAGGYQTVDAGESDPYCHRSAWMPTVGLSDGGTNLTSLNLACSGALTDSQTGADGVTRPGVDFAEIGGVKGQATRLQEFAAGNDVSMVALSLGGNDLGFSTIATKCVTSYAQTGNADKKCQDDPELAQILGQADQVKENIKTSIANIVQAMRAAGKADGSWKLVYQTPVLPLAKLDQIPDNFPEEPGILNLNKPRSVAGCPLWDTDWVWITDTVFPMFVNTMRQAMVESAATLAGVPTVFVDHTETFAGHRLCQAGAVDSAVNYEGGVGNGPGDADTKALWGPGNGQNTEWATGIVIGDQLTGSAHQKQNPLHPNYWGQRALSACLDGVLASGVDNKIMTCAQQGDGQDAKGRPAMAVQAVGDIWQPIPPDNPTPSVYLPLPESLRLADKDPFTGPQTKTYNVSDLGEAIPDNATALALNVTVANTTSPGYAQIFPGNLPDTQMYPTSVLNWETGERLANGVSVKIADDGTFKVHVSQGNADVFIDVTGYYRDEVPNGVQAAQAELTGTFAGVTSPTRVFDQQVAPGETMVDLTKSLAGGVVIRDPSKVLGVVVNITASEPAGSGHLRVQPSSQNTLTPTSVVNWTGSEDVVANSLIVTPGSDGKVKLFNGSGGTVRAIVDVTGVFVNDGTGAAFYPVTPKRLVDTRESGGPLAPGAFLSVGTTAEQVPAEATGLAFNLTEDGGTSRGHMRAQTVPGPTLTTTSIINWPAADHTRANASMLRKNVGNGGFHVYNGSGTETQAIVDLLGYFAPSAKASDTAQFPIG